VRAYLNVRNPNMVTASWSEGVSLPLVNDLRGGPLNYVSYWIIPRNSKRWGVGFSVVKVENFRRRDWDNKGDLKFDADNLP
jgi:hypothetical protein